MATCGMCNNDMNSGDGCTEHKIMLSDGTVIDSVRHTPHNSHIHDGRCVDCGTPPGDIHHPNCDSARKPDGSQVLIDASVYWDPDVSIDPRDSESDYVFIVVLKDHSDSPYDDNANLTAFDSYEKATEHIDEDDMFSGMDETELGIDALRVE